MFVQLTGKPMNDKLTSSWSELTGFLNAISSSGTSTWNVIVLLYVGTDVDVLVI